MAIPSHSILLLTNFALEWIFVRSSIDPSLKARRMNRRCGTSTSTRLDQMFICLGHAVLAYFYACNGTAVVGIIVVLKIVLNQIFAAALFFIRLSCGGNETRFVLPMLSRSHSIARELRAYDSTKTTS